MLKLMSCDFVLVERATEIMSCMHAASVDIAGLHISLDLCQKESTWPKDQSEFYFN